MRLFLPALTVLLLLGAMAQPASAKVADESVLPELTELSLEELMQIDVTTVSKSPRSLDDEAVAVFVLTRDEIRNSGVSTIPDALRLVPGLHVAQTTSQRWAVTARGFNSAFNNKFLVLVDGRSVLNPIINGVDWAQADVPLEQIERIEIIRGAGGILWESKAMNGVVNIITLSSQQTKGFLVRTLVGNEHKTGVLAQQGLNLGEDASFRIWGKYDDVDGLALHDGGSTNDGFDLWKGGFRLDWQAVENHTAIFTGEYLSGETEDNIRFADLSNPPDYMNNVTKGEDRKGGHFLASWEWQRDEDELLSLQAYYAAHRLDAALSDSSSDTVDLEFNHSLPLGDRHNLGWGMGFRAVHDENDARRGVAFNPADDTTRDYNIYIQDVFQLIPEKLSLTFSMKAEHNSYTGWEFQPSGRVLWKPTAGHTLWGAVSRAVRTPTRTDAAITADVLAFPGMGGIPVVVQVQGNSKIDSEEVISWEFGYRTRPNSWTNVDIALFYSQYDDLMASIPGTPYPQFTPDPFRIITPVEFQNALEGYSMGTEVSVRVEPVDWMRVNFNYAWLDVDLDAKTQGASTDGEKSSPEHQASILSSFDIRENWQLGATLRYVGRVQQFDIPAYLEGDLQLSWQPSDNLKLTLAGRNLFDSQHPEYQRAGFDLDTLEVQRSVLAKASWIF